jgi:hypothetical protein
MVKVFGGRLVGAELDSCKIIQSQIVLLVIFSFIKYIIEIAEKGQLQMCCSQEKVLIS